MSDFEAMRVWGPDLNSFSRSLTKIIQTLPPELGQRLDVIRRNYFAWYGFQGGYDRLNDRTVSQIFAEYQPIDAQPIASGEMDGVRYELHGPPPTPDGKPETERK